MADVNNRRGSYLSTLKKYFEKYPDSKLTDAILPISNTGDKTLYQIDLEKLKEMIGNDFFEDAVIVDEDDKGNKGKFLKLIFANDVNVYINLSDLIDIYTSGSTFDESTEYTYTISTENLILSDGTVEYIGSDGEITFGGSDYTYAIDGSNITLTRKSDLASFKGSDGVVTVYTKIGDQVQVEISEDNKVTAKLSHSVKDTLNAVNNISEDAIKTLQELTPEDVENIGKISETAKEVNTLTDIVDKVVDSISTVKSDRVAVIVTPSSGNRISNAIGFEFIPESKVEFTDNLSQFKVNSITVQVHNTASAIDKVGAVLSIVDPDHELEPIGFSPIYSTNIVSIEGSKYQYITFNFGDNVFNRTDRVRLTLLNSNEVGSDPITTSLSATAAVGIGDKVLSIRAGSIILSDFSIDSEISYTLVINKVAESLVKIDNTVTELSNSDSTSTVESKLSNIAEASGNRISNAIGFEFVPSTKFDLAEDVTDVSIKSIKVKFHNTAASASSVYAMLTPIDSTDDTTIVADSSIVSTNFVNITGGVYQEFTFNFGNNKFSKSDRIRLTFYDTIEPHSGSPVRTIVCAGAKISTDDRVCQLAPGSSIITRGNFTAYSDIRYNATSVVNTKELAETIDKSLSDISTRVENIIEDFSFEQTTVVDSATGETRVEVTYDESKGVQDLIKAFGQLVLEVRKLKAKVS